MTRPGPFVVMGVSGCGKSSVAQALAERVGGKFLDADDFHPAANKAKMANGIPLDDADRMPWLDALNAELLRRSRDAHGVPVFLACSALRQIYRDRLRRGLVGLEFVYLRGSRDVIASRMESRHGHFMPPALLDSQFATLEEPSDAVVADIDRPLETLVDGILSQIA